MSALIDGSISTTFRKRDVSQTYALARAEECSFGTMSKKGPKPKSTLYEFPFKKRFDPEDHAVEDAADVQDSEVINNESCKSMIQARTQKGRVVVGVDDVADELGEEYALEGTLLADNVKDGIIKARENSEVSYLKGGNSQSYSSGNPRKMRGLVGFIRSTNPGSGNDLPIPDDALTPSGNIVAGKAAAVNVTQDDFLNIMLSIVSTCRTNKSLHVFATPALRMRIASWTQFAPESAGNVSLEHWVRKPESKEILISVQRITCELGTFFLHTHFALPSGVHAIIVDMDAVKLRQVRGATLTELPYLGGVKKRMIEYILGEEVSNPQAHGKITT
jgi:hypothetical protein